MSTSDNEPYQHALPSQAGSWRRPLLIAVIFGAGLFVAFASREKAEEVRAVADQPRTTIAVAEQAPAAAAPRSVGAWTASSAGPAVSLDVASAQPPSAPPQLLVAAGQSPLEALVAPFKGTHEITPEAAKDLKRRLQEIRERGVDAVPAIRDFLRTRQDVEFDKMRGGKLAEQPTLRLALFDTLRQIGGAEAIDVSLEQLRTTQAPSEIATLAINLEEAAPGVYRDEAMRTVLAALQGLARTKDPLEVRPLFEALQMLGGPEAMTALERLPHNADTVAYLQNKDTRISPTVGMYALITLANLPNGGGIFSLADMAGDPNVPVEHRTVGPFQMLAQTTADQAKAGEELVELALAKQIPDKAWNAVADALAGKQLQFPDPPADGTVPSASGVVAPFVRGFFDDQRNMLYEERAVSRTWSATQVQQQLALIDTLLAATDVPAATQALQRARETLQRRRP